MTSLDMGSMPIDAEISDEVKNFILALESISVQQAQTAASEIKAISREHRANGTRDSYRGAAVRLDLSAAMQSRLDKLVNQAVGQAGLFEMFGDPSTDTKAGRVHDGAQICARALLQPEKLNEEEASWFVGPFQIAGLV